MLRPLLLTAALAGLTLGGCDSAPTSVEDFDIQPAVTVSTTSLRFTAGQSTAPTFTVRYQGLDAAPEASGEGGLVLELVGETGTPEAGTRTYAVGYAGEVPSGGAVEGTVTVRSQGGGREIVDTVQIRVINPVSIEDNFQSLFAVVEDYEGDVRQVSATGGTTTQVVTDGVSPNSNGLRALRVDASGSGSVVFARPVSAPDQGTFSFLLRSADAFTLTVAFVDQTAGGTETYTVEVPIAGGGTWRRYSIATAELFDGFRPVGSQAGGDGPLVSVSMSAGQAVTYFVDELAFGTSDGPTIEVNDFETPNNAYLCDQGLRGPTTGDVGGRSDGPTAQTFRFVEGGNCFGYNYQSNGGPALFLDAESDGALRLLIGDVSRAFNLFVFVEAGGSYSYNSGTVVPIEAGDGYRVVTVPLADLGSNLSELGTPGIRNVGFEIRRPTSDTTKEPITFSIDDIKLLGSN